MRLHILGILFITFVAFSKTSLKLVSNYNASKASPFASLFEPTQIVVTPSKDVEPQKSILEQYNKNVKPYRYNQKEELQQFMQTFSLGDIEMVLQDEPPRQVFQIPHYTPKLRMLQKQDVKIVMINPSEKITICINEVFTDMNCLTKTIKRKMPFCMSSFTKYPFFFDLYVTFFRTRQLLRPSIYFNVSLFFGEKLLVNKMWVRQMMYEVSPNHLRMHPQIFKNCHQNQTITIKNPQRFDMSFIVITKQQKYNPNGTPLDDNFQIKGQQFKQFIVTAKTSQITIYTKSTEHSDIYYPILYVPMVCKAPLAFQHYNIGIIYEDITNYMYPVYVTSSSSHNIGVQEIQLQSASQTVFLDYNPVQPNKRAVLSGQKNVIIAYMIVQKQKYPQDYFRNKINLKLSYTFINHLNKTQKTTITKQFLYIELTKIPLHLQYRHIYDLNLMRDDMDQKQKILNYNYSIANLLNIQIRLDRIMVNPTKFKAKWFRYNYHYIKENATYQEMYIQYVGNRDFPVSTIRQAVNFQFNGGISIPVSMEIFDRTLTCVYLQKIGRCKTIKTINFGYLKQEQQVKVQNLILRNLTPDTILIAIKKINNKFTSKKYGIKVFFNLTQTQHRDTSRTNNPLPDNLSYWLAPHMSINLQITLQIAENAKSAQIPLLINAGKQIFSPKIKYSFEMGKISVEPQTFSITYYDKIQTGQLTLQSTFQQTFSIQQIRSQPSSLQFIYNPSSEYQQNQQVIIPFIFNPHKGDNNITSQCCNSPSDLKKYFIDGVSPDNYHAQYNQVSIVLSTKIEKKIYLNVDFYKQKLVKSANSNNAIELIVLKQHSRSIMEFQVHNPYNETLKFHSFFLSENFLQKPKEFMNYFSYARKERTQAYFCVDDVNTFANYYLSPHSIKQMFKLQNRPTEMEVYRGDINYNFMIKNKYQKNVGVQINQYVKAMINNGKNVCYKFSTSLYIKALIETQMINQLMEIYTPEFIQIFLAKEYQHLRNQPQFMLKYDQFYQNLQVNFSKFCQRSIFPIFKFCHYFGLVQRNEELDNENIIKSKIKNTFIEPFQTKKMSFDIVKSDSTNLQYEMILINNFSKFDSYNIKVQLIEAKVKIQSIAFEKYHKINSSIFMMHYFTSIFKSLQNNDYYYRNQKINKNKIIPIYMTSQDFDQQKGIFKGQRYFQIANLSPLDIPFSHFGFNYQENISQFSGIKIQLENDESRFAIPNDSTQNFKLNFNFSSYQSFNTSNPYFHKDVDFYIYKHQEYYLSFKILFKIADNVLNGNNLKNQEANKSNSNNLIYIVLNFLSFGYICQIIFLFKNQEKQKNDTLQKIRIKRQKINPKNPQSSFLLDQQQKIHKQTASFAQYEHIGSKIVEQQKAKFVRPITEQQLNFFKSLKIKEEKILNQSSESDVGWRHSHEQQKKTLKQSDESQQKDSFQQSSFKQQISQIQNQSYSDESQQSISQSILPDGVSVCNELVDMDQQFGNYQFGFEEENKKDGTKGITKKKESEDQTFYYDVFSSSNPLNPQKKSSKESKENPFPWMIQSKNKKTKRTKKR